MWLYRQLEVILVGHLGLLRAIVNARPMNDLWMTYGPWMTPWVPILENFFPIEYSTRKMRVDFKLNYTKGGIWTVKFCHFHPFPAPKFKFNEQKKWNRRKQRLSLETTWSQKYCRTYWQPKSVNFQNYYEILNSDQKFSMIFRWKITFGSDRIFETLLKTARFCSSSEICFSKLFG